MAISIQKMTVEQFDEWVMLPENAEHNYEYIGREIFDVVTHPLASILAARFARYIGTFVESHELGYVTGADGGYQVGDERYMPDVGYISFARQPLLNSEEGYLPNTPDLAIEVASPTDSPRKLTIKISNYLAAGTVVWVVYPEDEQVDVHAPGKAVEVYKKEDILDGGTILPGFKLQLDKIFK